MFEQTTNNHLIHKEAIKLVLEQLSGATDMDSVSGYYAPYDIEWNNIKLLVKVAKLSKKAGQPTSKWFYVLKERDHKIADYFILFAVDVVKIIGIYILPRAFAPKVYITITKMDGNMRYNYFKTDLNNIGETLLKLQAKLPKLTKIHNEADKLNKTI